MKFVKDKSTNEFATKDLINPFHNCLFPHLEASNYTNALRNFLPGLKFLHAYSLSLFSCSTKTVFKWYLKVVILHPISNHISGHIAVQPALKIKLLMTFAWMAMDKRQVYYFWHLWSLQGLQLCVLLYTLCKIVEWCFQIALSTELGHIYCIRYTAMCVVRWRRILW